MRTMCSAAAGMLGLVLCCFEAWAEEPIGILLAAGDIAKCGVNRKKDEAVAQLIAQHVMQADEKQIPIHVLALGDLAYDHGTTANFKCFNESWGALQRLKLKNSDPKRLMLPVPGNHEYEQSGGMPYYNYFDKNANAWVFQQNEGEQKQPSGHNKGYYSLKFPDPKNGPWQLLGMNSELSGAAMETQLTWLEKELAASDLEAKPMKPACVLAFWHKPLFSSGTHGHGDCYGVKGKPCERTDAPLCRPEEDAPYCKAMKTMKKAYQAIHAQGGSVILAGHDHHFEQFKRLTSEAKYDEKGVRSFIVGTGGGSLYQKARTHRWGKDVRDVYNHSSYGILRLELYEDRYQWRFVHIPGDTEVLLKDDDGKITDFDSCVARPN